MTDLTEQWKKGELPNGYYWIRLSWGGMVIMAYHTEIDGLFELDDHYYDSDEISEVLAPVPSYEEWKAKLEQNAHLKELLKECLEVLKLVAGETIDFPHTVDECIEKINLALGDEKGQENEFHFLASDL